MTDPYDVNLEWLVKIILKNNEHPCYEFKKELQFNVKSNKIEERENRAELIRDLLALGNQALLHQMKSYLIIGASKGKITSISKEFDDNDFQVFLEANISPPMSFLYKNQTINKNKIGIFIILPEGSQIFTVKKNYYHLLTKGETWNRRGTKKYQIIELDELLKLQTQLSEIISEKSVDTISVTEDLKQEFWSSYLAEMKSVLKDLDFLGFSNLQDEPSVPLYDIFMSLQFKLEPEVLQNSIIKNRIQKFLETLNINDTELFNIPIEEEITQEQLIKLFDEICKIEDKNYHKTMYIQFLFLFRHLLIIGGPGFGKTTFLKYMWLVTAEKTIFSSFGIQDQTIPLFISLLEYESFLISKSLQESNKNSLLEFFVRKINPSISNEPISIITRLNIIRTQLYSGNTILLFDGVDEVSNLQLRNRILKDIEFFCDRYLNCMTIVSSRPLDQLDQLKNVGFFPLKVQPLQLYEINRFIFNWYSSKIRSKDLIQKQVAHLTHIIQTKPDLLSLASNPLMLTFIVIIHRIEGNIPEHRAILYQKTTDTFLETWDKKKGIDSLFTLDSIKKSLNILAFEIHSRFATGLGLDLSIVEAKRILFNHLQQNERLEILEAEKKTNEILMIFQARSGVLIFKNENITFWHSIFKDFFAAQYIKNNFISDSDRMWLLISKLILEEKWLPIIKLLFGLLSELPLDIIFDFTDRILQSSSIPVLNQFQVLNDILLENPDTASYLLPKVFNFGLEILNSLDYPKNHHTKVLTCLYPIIKLFSSENSAKILDFILKELIQVSTRPDKDEFLNILSRIFVSLYNNDSEVLLALLKERIPTDVLSYEIQSTIESLTNENLQLLRSMLEFPTLDNENAFLNYYKFNKYSISTMNGIESIPDIPNDIECYRTLLDSIKKCKEIFYHSIFFYFHYFLKAKKVYSSIEPFSFFREWGVGKDYNPLVNDLWMILNINNKIESFLREFQNGEGITKVVTRTPSRRKFYFYTTQKISLKPFKPVTIRLDTNPAQKMMDQSEFCFRFRIQMNNHLWFITKKIIFSDMNSLEEYKTQLGIFEQQIQVFGIIIIREEEYTIVNQGFKYLKQNQIGETLKLAQKALNLDEFFYPALYLKSEALGRLHRFEESDQVNIIIFEEFPNDSWVYYRQALNYSRSFRFEEILKIHKNETIENLSDVYFLLYKAEAYSRLGEYSKADSLFLKIKPKLIEKIEYQITNIEHLIRVDRINEAGQVISQIDMTVVTLNKLYYIRKLIILNLEIKNSTAVAKWIKKGKKIGITEGEDIYYQIMLLKAKGKIKKSLKLAELTIKKYLKDIDLLNQTGVIYLELKEYSKAKKLFQTVVELNAEFSGGWYNLACVYALEGNAEEALNALTKSISLEPSLRIDTSKDLDFRSLNNLKRFQELIKKKHYD